MHSLSIIKLFRLLALILVVATLLRSSPATTAYAKADFSDRLIERFEAGIAPVAMSNTYTVNEDQRLSVPAPGVLANDTDENGDPLTAILAGSASYGSLNLASNGSFSYTPNSNFNGVDSFSYRAFDGSLDSAEVTVTLTVNPVNDPPVITGLPGTLTLDEGSSLIFNLDEKVIDVETPASEMSWRNKSGDPKIAKVNIDAARVATIRAIEGEGRVRLEFNVIDRGDPNGCGEPSSTCSKPIRTGQTLVLTTNNLPPWVDAGPDQTVKIGEAFKIEASFTDPGIRDTHTATIDFGDGTGPQPAEVTQEKGSGKVIMARSYPEVMTTYMVQVCVTDDDGGTGCDSLAVTMIPRRLEVPTPFPEEPGSPDIPESPPEEPELPETPVSPEEPVTTSRGA